MAASSHVSRLMISSSAPAKPSQTRGRPRTVSSRGPHRISRGFVVMVVMVVMAAGFAGKPDVARSALADDDIVCRISEHAVQSIVDAAFPMDFSGIKKIEATVLGVKVVTEAPWKVTVESPKIALRGGEQTFRARVRGQAANVPTAGDVKGKLAISYDQLNKNVVVKVVEAYYPVSVGPLPPFTLDVTDDIPLFLIPLALPDIELVIRDRKVSLQTEPSLECVDGAIVVRSELRCTPSPKRAGR